MSEDVLLIFPPGFHPGQPPLGLPYLKAFMASCGFQARVLDLNLWTFHWFLQPERLKKNRQRAIDRLVDLQDADFLTQKEGEELPFLRYVLGLGGHICENMPATVAGFRNQEFYRHEQWSRLRNDLHFALRLGCTGFADAVFSLEVYHPACSATDTQKMLNRIGHRDENLLYEPLSEALGQIDFNVPLIGISVLERGQLHSALSLAFLLKKQGYKGHITLGGSWISRFAHHPELLNPFFEFVDSFCFFEGEFNLPQLCAGLKKNDFSRQGDFYYYDRVKKEARRIINHKPLLTGNIAPDFSDLPLNSYFAPELVIPLQIRGGCPYGKCAFCEHPVFVSEGRRQLPYPKAGAIVDIMQQIETQTGACNFYFVDEMLPPAFMDDLSAELKKRNLQYPYIAYAGFSAALSDRERVKSWMNGGLRKLWMGLESTDENMLRLMNKGRKTELVEGVLKNFQACGLPVHLFCLMGFPGETAESMEKTVSDILRWQPLLDNPWFSLDLFRFTLGINSEVYKNREKFGIEGFPKGDIDIAQNQWKLKSGPDSEFVADRIAAHKKLIYQSYKTKPSLLQMNMVQDSSHLLYIEHPPS
jgi:hypothetical protein